MARSSRHVAVAAPNTDAARAGLATAAEGGNAVDAALAAVLVTCVNEPGMVSLAAGGYATVALPGREAVTVDGYVEMPGRGLPAAAFGRGVWPVHTSYGGGTTMSTGPGTVATPGLLPAVEETHRRFGALPWAAIVEPAEQIARDGFALGMACDHFLGHVGQDLYGHDPATRAALHHGDGTRVRAGQRMVIADLGDFLGAVRRTGSAALTTGAVADALVDLMAAGGGLVTHEDLAAYTPVVRPSARADLAGGWSVATNPPPSIGGPVLAAMVLLLDAGPGDVADLVRVVRAVLAHRLEVLDVSADRAAATRVLLDRVRGGGRGWLGSPSTAHVSAVDQDGTACSVTTSFGYGSGITLPGTGVWLNNCLGEHELNVTGLHALAPGTRLASNMAPSVVRHGDGTVLAIGSPGADRITTALAQVISRVCRHGRSAVPDGEALAAAVGAPRLHVGRDRGGLEVLHHEADLALDGLDTDLPRRAHPASSMYFGGVAAALHGPDGALAAAADPRRDGACAVSGRDGTCAVNGTSAVSG